LRAYDLGVLKFTLSFFECSEGNALVLKPMQCHQIHPETLRQSMRAGFYMKGAEIEIQMALKLKKYKKYNEYSPYSHIFHLKKGSTVPVVYVITRVITVKNLFSILRVSSFNFKCSKNV
jgi:hypothetical protein